MATEVWQRRGARADGPGGSAGRTLRPRSTPYDPATETDPLIRAHITRSPVTGEVVFLAKGYPVWAIVLNLHGTNFDWHDVARSYPELSREDLEAAERFWQRHADEIRLYLD